MKAKQLKNSILQLAVEGKLVAQDPNDEPASVLVERIAQEKKRLIKEKKIKKEKVTSFIFKGADNLPYENINGEVKCIVDEIPFDIPESWAWVRLGSIFEQNTGKALNSKNTDGNKQKYITTSNLYWHKFDLDKLKEMYFKDNELPKYSVQYGDLLVCEGGDIGRAAVWKYDFSVCIQNHIHRLRPFFTLNVDFYNYILFLYKNIGLIGGQGIAIKGLSSNAIKQLLIPLPPLPEQNRIVAKIEELLPFIAKFEEKETALTTLNTQFPEQLKKSILQYAIEGKLVEQDPNDEPASVLIEKIRTEKQTLIKQGKIKKSKSESIIFRRDNSHYEKNGKTEKCIDDEIPFDIPESWEWVRLGSIAELYTGNSINQSLKNTKYANLLKGYNYIGTKDVNFDNSINYENGIKISFEENKFRYAFPDSILLCIEGGSAGRKIAITEQKICFGNKLCCFDTINFSHKFLFFLIQSNVFQNIFVNQISGIIGGVSINKLKKMLIPLPPLSEQKRIVEKIEFLINKIEKL